MTNSLHQKLNGWPSMALGVSVLVGVLGYGGYTYYNLEEERTSLLLQLETARAGNYGLMQMVDEREDVINSFQGQLENLGSTVGVLQKLSQTDEELLKKYSKIYFLNENYIPSKLSEIEKNYLNKGATNTKIHSDVLPHLENLLAEANQEGHKLLVASAYRSFQTQSALKSSYTVTYGAGANSFSADQGYSEHQLGTAVDFTTEKLGANFNALATDPAYKWLQANAHDYGFILSYPSGNTYYKFEPWHWRYVGIELATYLHEEKRNFYDLDQRVIDTYLIKLFQ